MKRSFDKSFGSIMETPNKKIRSSSSWDYLVQDTIKLILAKLDPKTQRYARLVCKQWFDIINLSEFNIGALYHDELPLVISVLGRYNKPISVSFKNLNHVKEEDIQKLAQLTSLTSLSVNLEEEGFEYSDVEPSSINPMKALTTHAFLSALTNLRSFTTGSISCNIFSIATSVTKLSCTSPYEPFVGQMIEPVTQLVELDISPAEQPTNISFNKFPNLKRLATEDLNERCQLTGLESLVLTRTSDVSNYPVTLTQLVISEEILDSEENFYEIITQLTRLKDIDVYDMNPSRHILSHFPALERCSVQVRDNGLAVWQDLATSDLSFLTSLRIKLKVFPAEEQISVLTRLKELDMILESEFEIEEALPFDNNPKDMAIFSSLVNLTKLSFASYFYTFAKELVNFQSLTNLTALQNLIVNHHLKEPFVHNCTNLTSLEVLLHPHLISNKKHCFTALTNLVDLSITMSESTKLTDVVEYFAFDSLTLLTRLYLGAAVSDEEWAQITKLTNLRMYEEYQYDVTINKDRFMDLTALKHLTSLIIRGEGIDSNVGHLTALTTLQEMKLILKNEDDYQFLAFIKAQLPLMREFRQAFITRR